METKPPVEPTKPKLPSKDELVAKLESKAAEARKTLAGKKGVNPFIWVNTAVNPLIAEIKNAPAVTDEHVAKVAALELPKETVIPVTEVEPKPTLRV